MIIDFTEIKDDHEFENFAKQFLERKGLKITEAPAKDPDGGRDIICEEMTMFNTPGFRWLVSCKHYAKSNKSIGVNEDEAKANKLVEHGCNGFMFVFSTPYTEGFKSSVQKVCSKTNSQFQIFNSYDLREQLISEPKFYPLIRA